MEEEFADVEDYEEYYNVKQRIQTRKCKKSLKNVVKKSREEEKLRIDKVLELIEAEDWERLEKFVKSLMESNSNVIDKSLDNAGNTLLHLAAKNKLKGIFRIVLENGANPCLKNKQGCTPYQCAQGKDIRRILKRFAVKFPKNFNYVDAGLPVEKLG